jgi:endonuclease III
MPQKKVYSNDLGIDLNSGDETECFKWFLACLLFGKPIQQEIAKRAFLELRQAGITSPNAVLETGWNGLVEILDKAHYVRYDFSTATKLLDISEDINKKYGAFGALLKQCSSTTHLSERLQELKGVGPKTAEIFLRDMTPILEKQWGYTI